MITKTEAHQAGFRTLHVLTTQSELNDCRREIFLRGNENGKKWKTGKGMNTKFYVYEYSLEAINVENGKVVEVKEEEKVLEVEVVAKAETAKMIKIIESITIEKEVKEENLFEKKVKYLKNKIYRTIKNKVGQERLEALCEFFQKEGHPHARQSMNISLGNQSYFTMRVICSDYLKECSYLIAERLAHN